MDIHTWITPCGEWKAQYVSAVAKGPTREEAIANLKKEFLNENKESSEL
jgi:hypothetical protein